MVATNTSKQFKPPHRRLMKEQKKKEITSLLALTGPMEAKAIAQMLDDVSEVTVQRYLDQLATEGHIGRVRVKGRPRNARAYALISEYGAKMDIVSRALSHPLHQLSLSFVRKLAPKSRQLIEVGCSSGALTGECKKINADYRYIGLDTVES